MIEISFEPNAAEHKKKERLHKTIAMLRALYRFTEIPFQIDMWVDLPLGVIIGSPAHNTVNGVKK